MSRQYFCVLFVALMMLLVSALGQEALSITVSTDKQNYDRGQAVLITVKVQQFGAPVASTVVYFELRDPQNQVKASGFMITDSTGKYSKQIMIGDSFPLGSYTVYVSVTVGSQSASATAVFQTIPEFAFSLVLVVAFVVAIGMLSAFGKRELRKYKHVSHVNIIGKGMVETVRNA